MKRGLLYWAARAVRLRGFRLPSSLSPALLHHLRQSLSAGRAHSTAPLLYRSVFPSRALSGTAGRVNPFERSNGLAYASLSCSNSVTILSISNARPPVRFLINILQR